MAKNKKDENRAQMGGIDGVAFPAAGAVRPTANGEDKPPAQDEGDAPAEGAEAIRAAIVSGELEDDDGHPTLMPKVRRTVPEAAPVTEVDRALLEQLSPEYQATLQKRLNGRSVAEVTTALLRGYASGQIRL